MPHFEHVTSLPLARNGDCSLLGVTGDLRVYVEEIYGDDGWMAQRVLQLDGTTLAVMDEDSGNTKTVQPLSLPHDLVKPKPGWHTMGLNFSGARHRGIRSLEHVTDIAQPLSLEDKAVVAGRLQVATPMILGLAESYVLAEADLELPHLFLVCRRLRVVYGLEAERTDEQNQPYDYDSAVLYVAHTYDRSQDVKPTLRESLKGLASVELWRPMDCLIAFHHMFIADGGEGERVSQVHVWKIVRSHETAHER